MNGTVEEFRKMLPNELQKKGIFLNSKAGSRALSPEVEKKMQLQKCFQKDSKDEMIIVIME